MNDLVLDARGNLYFTDQSQTGLHDPTRRVYRLGPDGRLDDRLWPSSDFAARESSERKLPVATCRQVTTAVQPKLGPPTDPTMRQAAEGVAGEIGARSTS